MVSDFVAHHVEQNTAAKSFRFVLLHKLFGKITAPEKTVGLGEGFVGFFAIEKNELHFPGEIGTQSEHAGHLEQHAGIRAAIVCSDECHIVESLGVEVRKEQERRRAFFAAEGGDQIHELHFPSRRVIAEALSFHFPAGKLELLCQVSSRFFDRLTPGRARAEIDHGLHVSERFFAGKFFPDFLAWFCADFVLARSQAARRSRATKLKVDRALRRSMLKKCRRSRDFSGIARGAHDPPLRLGGQTEGAKDALQIIVAIIFNLNAPRFSP